MIMRVRLLIVAIAAQLAVFSHPAAAQVNDLLLVFNQDGFNPHVIGGGEDPGTPILLEPGEATGLPQAILDDVAELNAAIEARAGAVWRRQIEATLNGRSLLVVRLEGQTGGEASNVYIWPDWRNAQNVIAFDPVFTEAEWLSNHHVLLHDGKWDISARYRVVDWGSPEDGFEFPASVYRRAKIWVGDNGRWVSETKAGPYHTGLLARDAQDEIIVNDSFTIDGELGVAMFLHGGDVLALDIKTGERQHEIRTYTFDDEGAIQPAATWSNGLIYHEWMKIADAGFYGRMWEGELDPDAFNAELAAFSVTEQGAFAAATAVNYDDDYAHLAMERPADVSPSGKFARTQRRDPIGGIAYRYRRTPLAGPADPLPDDAAWNRAGPPVWLAWEDE